MHPHIAAICAIGAICATAALLAATTTAWAQDKHQATRGGVFASAKEADYELVAKPRLLQLYVSDHGKPMDPSKASARLTLLAGTRKQEVQLTPAGDKLEASGSFETAAGTRVVAVVSNSGKTLGTPRFTLK